MQGDRQKKTIKREDLDIPPGVGEGVKIRYRNFGNAGYQGGPSGDLIVQIRLKPHPLFQRKGSDLIYQAEISYPEAVMGKTLDINTLYGPEKLKIPPGTESGTIFTLKKQRHATPSSRQTKRQPHRSHKNTSSCL
jgi:molecular chaperone DnaJ